MLKTTYKTDSFTDYAGRKRSFVLALVSCPICPPSDLYPKGLKASYIGLSVCHEDDTFNEELGQKIAKGKAQSDKRIGRIIVDHNGFMNTKIAETISDSIAEYIKQNPGDYIAGYNKKQDKWMISKHRNTLK